MKVLVFYASYGGGHLSAAKSIQEYIDENYADQGVETELIDCVKYVNKTIESITTAAYRGMAKKAPWVWGRIYSDSQKGPLAHLSSRSNMLLAIKLLKLLREKKPDLIISTHPFGSQMCTYLRRKGKINCKIATILTDFAPHDQWLVGAEETDYFFVANEKMKKYIENKKVTNAEIHVTGIPISGKFLKNYNRSKVLDHYGLAEDKLNVLFFGGGEFGLGKSRTVSIFESFVKHSGDKAQVIAIAGKNEAMKEQFEEVVKEYDKEDCVKVLGFTKRVPALMSISDVVVTKPGGLTTSESLASHLPMVVINPIPGQEEENAAFLENKGIAVWIRKDSNVDEIVDNLLSNPTRLKNMSSYTYELAHKYSTRDICEVLLG